MSKKNKHRPQPPQGPSATGQTAPVTPEVPTPSPEQLAKAIQDVTQRREAATDAPIADAGPTPATADIRELKDTMYRLVNQLDADTRAAKRKLTDVTQREQKLATDRNEIQSENAAVAKDRKDLDADRQKFNDERGEILKLRAARESGFQTEHGAALKSAEEQLQKILADHATMLQKQRDELRALADQRVQEQHALNKELAALRSKALQELDAELAQHRDAAAAAEIQARQQLNVDRDNAAALLREANVERALAADEKAVQSAIIDRLATQRAQRHDAAIDALENRITALTHELKAARQAADEYAAYQRAFAPHTPETALAQTRKLEQDLADARLQLAHAPTAVDGQEMVRLRDRVSDLHDQLRQAKEDHAKRDAKISNLQVAATHLETAKREVAALEHTRQILTQRLEELQQEVGKYVDSDKDKSPLQFFIDAFDAKSDFNTAPTRATPPKDLTALAHGVRTSLSGGIDGRPLYYSEADIRSYLAGMAASRLILLQGISGTGKTSLVRAVAKTMGAGFASIPVQAGWRDRTELLGYYNAFHRKFYQRQFTEALYAAGTPKHRDRPYFILLDEINLSRVEQFFADFLSVLEEPDRAKWRIELMSEATGTAPLLMPDGRHLAIPSNVWFVGTANQDETTTGFADKTYDRAHVLEPTKVEPFSGGQATTLPTAAEWLQESFDKACKTHAEPSKKARKWIAERSPVADALRDHGRIALGNRLDHQLDRFVPASIAMGGKLGDAVDEVLASRVLRKLKDRHEIQATALKTLRQCIEDQWSSLDGTSKPTRCLAFLQDEIRKKG
jgi:MoxR-like ATPase